MDFLMSPILMILLVILIFGFAGTTYLYIQYINVLHSHSVLEKDIYILQHQIKTLSERTENVTEIMAVNQKVSLLFGLDSTLVIVSSIVVVGLIIIVYIYTSPTGGNEDILGKLMSEQTKNIVNVVTKTANDQLEFTSKNFETLSTVTSSNSESILKNQELIVCQTNIIYENVLKLATTPMPPEAVDLMALAKDGGWM